MARKRTQALTSSEIVDEEEDEGEDELNNEISEQEINDIADTLLLHGNDEQSVEHEDDDSTEKISNIEVDSFYAVYYTKKFYIGKVVKAYEDDSFDMTFLHSVSSNAWNWPKRKDEARQHLEDIFYGPVKLEGHGPFSIDSIQLCEISKLHKELKQKNTKK